MRYRMLATYRGVPYEAGVGPTGSDVVLFAACPPPEELGFEPATGHWRKRVIRAEIDALWESRPVGTFRGEPCIVLDDLGDRLHIAYLGTDATAAARLGYWQIDRGVFELLTPREDVTGLTEERVDKPLSLAPPLAAAHPGAGHLEPERPGGGPTYPYGGLHLPSEPAPSAGGYHQPAPGEAGYSQDELGPPVYIQDELGPHGFPQEELGPPGYSQDELGAPSYAQDELGLPVYPRDELGAPAYSGEELGAPAYSGDEPGQPGHQRRGAGQAGYPEGAYSGAGAAHGRHQPDAPNGAGSPALNGAAAATAPAEPAGAPIPWTGAGSPAPAGAGNGGRSAGRRRVTVRDVFCELADLAAIPRSAYALGTEAEGALCLLPTAAGFEVFIPVEGARHEVRSFADEEAAYFYLFGVLAAEAVLGGRLAPGSLRGATP